ncbi:uncharacterized protein LOC106872938 [Octopus bimaculoides]|uniref:uncharacterized protein LOC106872938 n=1 Tax=Octopus bimaculoides TaxID=37653 RepID=UPI00071E17A5|nr:uncharacterized protein LOC106872938 [Octopus bimaculoides]|eukprot:XP_014775604.1 PREDICTED: uncharacterized protein LOC106872938 [Octopus bimaculoides]
MRELAANSMEKLASCEGVHQGSVLNTVLCITVVEMKVRGDYLYKQITWCSLPNSNIRILKPGVLFLRLSLNNKVVSLVGVVLQLWSQEDGRPIFNKIMIRGSFQQILLCFDDVSVRRKKRNDKLVFEMSNHNLQDGYVPSSCMTVDEQSVSFGGRCPFQIFIPSKPWKYGIKIWAMCESETSHAWKMQIYTGKDPVKVRETSQGSGVVEDLVKELENTGCNIICDNFFTSLGLARKLFSEKTLSAGTIRKKRVELPSTFTNG